MGKKLFVGGLSWDTTDQSLRACFEAYGEVVDAKVILDRETGRSRGFGFVTLTEEDAVTKAVDGMNGAQLDGRSIRVNVAEERSSRPRPQTGGHAQSRGSDGGNQRSGQSGPRAHGHSDNQGQPNRYGGGGQRGGGWRPPPDGATAGGIPFDPGPSGRTDEAYKRKKQKKKRQGGEGGGDPNDARDRGGSSKRKSGRNWRDFGAQDDDE